MRKQLIASLITCICFFSSIGCAAPIPPDTESYEIGYSVENKPISVTRVGNGKDLAICIIGGIHGDEGNTCALVEAIKNDYTEHPSLVPKGIRLYFLPVLNPDGILKKIRRNSHNVDLNRNFPALNWQKDAISPSTISPGSGGKAAGSEPETASVMTWLLEKVKKEARNVWVFSYHSLYPPNGAVQAGYIQYGKPEKESERLARVIANYTGYKYLDTWITSMKLTGELLGWCELENMRVVDIELPVRAPPATVQAGARVSSLDVHRALLPKLFDLYE